MGLAWMESPATSASARLASLATCAISTSTTAFPDACLNGGECVDDVNFFWCFCPNTFGGDFCEVLLDPETGFPDRCAFEDCARRGACSNLQQEPWFFCECELGVRGERLKGGSVIYACSPSSEQLNSTCLPDGKFDNPPICGEGNQGGNKTVFMMTGVFLTGVCFISVVLMKMVITSPISGFG
ncbi:unnamed protein product [Oikopleura dioica]|uniref:EGF-like domain-containing protein n=1 Tax=Oikopleura dioica TaxID=34765 RepID=E4YSR6_OIKDI|nr:unnamed protein product [Oikopleura dioica]